MKFCTMKIKKSLRLWNKMIKREKMREKTCKK